jgi:hypothetical protein
MRNSTFAVMAVLGLASWQMAPANLAQAASTPPTTMPCLADGADATGVDNVRLAEGGNSSGVETSYRLSEGANASGVDNSCFADGAEGTGMEVQYRTAEGANASGVDNGRTPT